MAASREYEEKTDHFPDSDGTDIFYRYSHSSSDKAAVVLCHGLGEHSGRYGNLFAPLRRGGYSYYAMDHRGHGNSGGARGCILHFEQFLPAVREVAKIAREGVGKGKVFLFGHSMGGLIAAHVCLRFPESVQGLILSSPAFELAYQVPRVKAVIGQALSGLLPGLTLSSGIDPVVISRDPQVVRDYESDPLNHQRVSTRLFTEMLSAMGGAMSRAAVLRLPVLIFHGTGDELTKPAGSRAFYETISSEDKTMKLYEGFYHETINEIGKEEVIRFVMDWLDAHR